MRKLQPYLIGLVFVAAGALHFKHPGAYEAIVPPFLPRHRELVLLSGFFEMLGGAGVVVVQTRKAAGWGLIALLIAVFPANIYMAVAAEHFAKVAPAAVLYGRLPLQLLLVAWVWAACVKD
ncbi:MAG: DoxX family protein [Vulcanimicrobiaceae bacterium]